LVKNKVISPLVFEKPTVTGDTFLAMTQKIAFRHVSVETVFPADDAPPHFFRRVFAFLVPFPGSLIVQI
jgi:hypothetical protein